MDKRFRNLGIVIVVILIIVFLLNSNLFIGGLSENESMHAEFENIYIKNNVDGNNIKSLTFAIADEAGNITYVEEKSALLNVKTDISNLKLQLNDKYNSELAREGKMKAEIIIEAIDFLFVEDEILKDLVDLKSNMGPTMCDNAQIIVDLNTLMGQRSDALIDLSNLVDVYNVDYNSSEQVVAVNKEIEEMSELYFATTTQDVLDECGLGLLSPELSALIDEVNTAFLLLGNFIELRGIDSDTLFYESLIDVSNSGEYNYDKESYLGLKEDLPAFLAELDGALSQEVYELNLDIGSLIMHKIELYDSYYATQIAINGLYGDIICEDLKWVVEEIFPNINQTYDLMMAFEEENIEVAQKHGQEKVIMNSGFDEHFSQLNEQFDNIELATSACLGDN